MARNLNDYPSHASKLVTKFSTRAISNRGGSMGDTCTFDIHDFVNEASQQVARIDNHPFHQHLIAILAIETRLYHEAQAHIDTHGLTIINNGAQECINPAVKISFRATRNILKLRKALGLSQV